jgi:hypothetical protein
MQNEQLQISAASAFLHCLQNTNRYEKIEREIFNPIYYEHKPEPLPPLRDNDPMIIRGYGNDVEVACCKDCFCRYPGLE